MIDPNLVNAWGIAVAPSGPLWISTNGTGLSVIYNQSGMALRPPVTIPSADVESTGTPSGQVFNSTSGFVIPGSGSPAKFIFVAEDGTVSAWNGGNVATVVADRSASNAVYKGVEIASDGVDTFLYAADLHNARIDVFDRNFQYVPGMGFHDPYMPAGFAPFNIRDIGGWLYVTYAKQAAPDNHDDLAGPGNGFVDIFKPGGQFVKRFASHGPLNSPWGIVQAQLGFSDMPDAILIGNFGDGRINVFDEHGNFFGSLKDQKGKDIVIDGLWAIQNNVPGADPAQLFFTAGPNGESHGLFGFIKRQ
jgi:uncharacterized protein (TIGR03118 family)